MSQGSSSSHGIGFYGAFTLMLAWLKLTGQIGWSWPWVFLPFAVEFVLACVSVAIARFLASK